MTRHEALCLLAPDEPDPVLVHAPDAGSPFVITVDHAGRRIPRSLGTLGLSEAQIARHIGWDIGILAVSEAMQAEFACPLFAQIYSRLVIDCNRRPGTRTSIPEISESDVIAGNIGLSDGDRLKREATFLEPYQVAIGDCLDERARLGHNTYLLAMHSFTPHYKNEVRPMAAAVLWGPDDRLGRLVLEEMRRLCPSMEIAANQPYAVDMQNDYTVPVQAEARGLPYVEIEVRQDLISDPPGIAAWAKTLAIAIRNAVATFEEQSA